MAIYVGFPKVFEKSYVRFVDSNMVDVDADPDYAKRMIVYDDPDPRFFTDLQFLIDNPDYKVGYVTLEERQQKRKKYGEPQSKWSWEKDALMRREARHLKLQQKMAESRRRREEAAAASLGLKKSKNYRKTGSGTGGPI